MLQRLRMFNAIILLLFTARASLAQYYWPNNQYTYYETYYPEQSNTNYYQQQNQHPQQNRYQQQNQQQQQNKYQFQVGKVATEDVPAMQAEAEWICRNPKTNDMMLIVPETDTRSNVPGQGQWQQITTNTQYGYPLANQNAPVQNPNTNWQQRPNTNNNNQPNYPQPKPVYTTTERPDGPIWSIVGQGNQQPPVHGNPSYSTTERPAGPIWSDPNYPPQSKPTHSTTTPAIPVWPTNGSNLQTTPAPTIPTRTTTKAPPNDVTALPGFTVNRPTQTPPPQSFKNPVFPPFEPTLPPATISKDPSTEDDDGGPIQIVMG